MYKIICLLRHLAAALWHRKSLAIQVDARLISERVTRGAKPPEKSVIRYYTCRKFEKGPLDV